MTKTVKAEAEAPEEVEAPESGYVPTVDDFKVSLKVLSKQCFGDAGCNWRVRIKPLYFGEPIGAGETAEVTYQIVGTDDEYTNTFTMAEDGNAEVPQEEAVGSASDKALTVKVTDVSIL